MGTIDLRGDGVNTEMETGSRSTAAPIVAHRASWSEKFRGTPLTEANQAIQAYAWTVGQLRYAQLPHSPTTQPQPDISFATESGHLHLLLTVRRNGHASGISATSLPLWPAPDPAVQFEPGPADRRGGGLDDVAEIGGCLCPGKRTRRFLAVWIHTGPDRGRRRPGPRRRTGRGRRRHRGCNVSVDPRARRIARRRGRDRHLEVGGRTSHNKQSVNPRGAGADGVSR